MIIRIALKDMIPDRYSDRQFLGSHTRTPQLSTAFAEWQPPVVLERSRLYYYVHPRTLKECYPPFQIVKERVAKLAP